MKIKKSELEKIIAEEIEKMLSEQVPFSNILGQDVAAAYSAATQGQPPPGGFSGMLPKAQKSMKVGRATALQNKLLRSVKSINDVKSLQKILNKAGFNAGQPDGRVGRNTIAAIKKLQSVLDVKEDGKYGKDTHAAWKKLGFVGGANLMKRAATSAKMRGDTTALDKARAAHVAAGGKLKKGKAVKGSNPVTAAYPK